MVLALALVAVAGALSMVGARASGVSPISPDVRFPVPPAGGYRVAHGFYESLRIDGLRIANAEEIAQRYASAEREISFDARLIANSQDYGILMRSNPAQEGVPEHLRDFDLQLIIAGDPEPVKPGVHTVAYEIYACRGIRIPGRSGLVGRERISGTAVSFTLSFTVYNDPSLMQSFRYDKARFELDMARDGDTLTLPMPVLSPSSATRAPGIFAIDRYASEHYGIVQLDGERDGALKLRFTRPGTFTFDVACLVIDDPEYWAAIGSRNEVTVVAKNRVTDRSLDALSIAPEHEWYHVGANWRMCALPTPASMNVDMVWSSSDERVAAVDVNGEVRIKSPGWVTITATAQDMNRTQASFRFECIRRLEEIDLDDYIRAMLPGQTLQLKPAYSPSNATHRWVDRYESNKKNVATVDASGMVTAQSVGDAFITAYGADGAKGFVYISVRQPVEAITLTSEDGGDALYVGEKKRVAAQVQPKSLQQSVRWSVNNARLASFSGGVLKAKKAGRLTLTAAARDGSGVRESLKLTIYQRPRSMKMNRRSVVLYAGTNPSVPHAVLLKPVVNKGAGYKALRWSVEENAAAVSVSENGLVTAAFLGVAVVRATTDTGKSCTATVRVKRLMPSMRFTADRLALPYGKKLDMRGLIEDYRAYDPVLKWRSSNPKIAKVDASGIVTALRREGSAVITATTLDGLADSCTIYVNRRGALPPEDGAG